MAIRLLLAVTITTTRAWPIDGSHGGFTARAGGGGESASWSKGWVLRPLPGRSMWPRAATGARCCCFSWRALVRDEASSLPVPRGGTVLQRQVERGAATGASYCASIVHRYMTMWLPTREGPPSDVSSAPLFDGSWMVRRLLSLPGDLCASAAGRGVAPGRGVFGECTGNLRQCLFTAAHGAYRTILKRSCAREHWFM